MHLKLLKLKLAMHETKFPVRNGGHLHEVKCCSELFVSCFRPLVEKAKDKCIIEEMKKYIFGF